jgi:hypothetical protein
MLFSGNSIPFDPTRLEFEDEEFDPFLDPREVCLSALAHVRDSSSIIVPEKPYHYKKWAEELMSKWEELIENPRGHRLANLRKSRSVFYKFRKSLWYRLYKATIILKAYLEFNVDWLKGV